MVGIKCHDLKSYLYRAGFYHENGFLYIYIKNTDLKWVLKMDAYNVELTGLFEPISRPKNTCF